MTEGRCDCGSVAIAVPHLPETVNGCRSRVLAPHGRPWGIPPGRLDRDRRADAAPPAGFAHGRFHRCTGCGVLTHWIDPAMRVKTMGVHMQNVPRALLGGVRIVVEP